MSDNPEHLDLVERAKSIDMDDFVVDFLSKNENEHVSSSIEGMHRAMDAIDVCLAMNKLGQVGAFRLELDDGADAYACRAFLIEYVVNSGMGHMLGDGYALRAQNSGGSYHECIIIMDSGSTRWRV